MSLETPHVVGGKAGPIHRQAKLRPICAAVEALPPRGLWCGTGSERFHTALRSFAACSRGHSVSPSIVIFLSPTVFLSNLIGGSGSLEQPAPSPLQVAVFFNRILKGAGHGCLLVSAALPAPWPHGIQFPNSLSGDAVPTGIGGRGASPVAVGGSGRSRSGTR